MKAMLIRSFGPPDMMQMETVDDPVAGPDEVVVAVKAVSVNRTLDLALRAGTYKSSIALPHVLGTDPSGVVVAVGADVADRKVGDRVACSGRLRRATASMRATLLGVDAWGGYAEYVKVPADMTYVLPDSLDFPSATVVTRHAPMALSLLRDRAGLQAGEWVLIMGAAGGLGSAGIQLATILGAKVIAAAGSDDRVRSCLDLGATAGVNYRRQPLRDAVMDITGGKGANLVFENVGDPDLFEAAFAALGRYGRLITAGAHAGGKVPLDLHHLYMNQIKIIGATGYTDADVEFCYQQAASGRLTSVISEVLPLSEAPLAHRLVDGRTLTGKVILDPTLG